MFVSALSDPTSNSERSANGGNKQILYCKIRHASRMDANGSNCMHRDQAK